MPDIIQRKRCWGSWRIKY